MKVLVTEKWGEVWIYNKKSSHLFKDKDISRFDPQLVHTIRGIRLGYPSPEYFLTALEQQLPSLQVTIFLGDIKVYVYSSPLTEASGCQAVTMWFKFKPFADAFEYNLTLELTEHLI